MRDVLEAKLPEKTKSPKGNAAESVDPRIVGQLMRRQAALGMRVAVVFLLLVFGLPLLTHFRPDISQQAVFGFPFSWFLLGILFYPITWALSAYFVKASERLEREEAEQIRAEQRRK